MAFLGFHLAHVTQKTGSPSSPQANHLHITPYVPLASCQRGLISTPPHCSPPPFSRASVLATLLSSSPVFRLESQVKSANTFALKSPTFQPSLDPPRHCLHLSSHAVQLLKVSVSSPSRR